MWPCTGPAGRAQTGVSRLLPDLPAAVLECKGPARVALTLWQVRDDVEHDRILRALAAVSGNRTQAARRLGVSRQALHERLRKYGIGAGAGRPARDDAGTPRPGHRDVPAMSFDETES